MIPSLRPVLTEKSLTLAAKGWYTFAVATTWNKRKIAREVAALYKVTVEDVRTSRRHGKERRVGRRQMRIRLADTKRALVLLPSGQSIPAFEITSEGEKK